MLYRPYRGYIGPYKGYRGSFCVFYLYMGGIGLSLVFLAKSKIFPKTRHLIILVLKMRD
jgi:hypothetical protein